MFLKKRKARKLKLVTHDNRFHADDVFATSVLFLVLGEDNVKVVRTRDKKAINSADYVYDVGGVYDEDSNRFDHHQEGGAGHRDNGVGYSSLGLIWKKYGKQVSGSQIVSDFIDEKIVQSVDALDNGTTIYKVNRLGLHPQTLNSVISSFWPTWLEDFDGDHFKEAVQFAKGFLLREIKRASDREKARSIIDEVYQETKDKRIIVLKKDYPHEDILSEYEKTVFVVKPRGGRNRWIVESLRNDPLSFSFRKKLPAEWAGKDWEDLQKITGVKDAIFCHKKRFVVVAKSQEGATKLAKLALKK
ncbi:MYG1 family protein [Patescibacteria group bacterium]|nr:MYG1 family protein [Patescibacteria group bacterium]